MDKTDLKEYSNQSLILIITHENLYEKSLTEQAKVEFEKRDLSELEVTSLARIQEEMIEKCRELISNKTNSNQIYQILKNNEIQSSLTEPFEKSLKPSNKIGVAAFLIFIYFIIRYFIKYFGEY